MHGSDREKRSFSWGQAEQKFDMFPSARVGRPKFMQMNTTVVQRSRGGVQEGKHVLRDYRVWYIPLKGWYAVCKPHTPAGLVRSVQDILSQIQTDLQ